MKYLFILATLLIFSNSIHAQQIDYYTPAEIRRIIDDSQIGYNFKSLDQEILEPNRDNKLIFNYMYRVILDGKFHIKEYKLGAMAKSLSNKAEKYFRSNKLAQARFEYMKLFELDSTYYIALTYIGQTYSLEGNFEVSIEWYKKAIEKNYIDYMAHWFLADAYSETGQLDKALKEITIAQILNRNSPRIKSSFFTIYSKHDYCTEDWYFTPQYKLDSISEKDIHVAFDLNWAGYAIAKAAWRYEPSFQKRLKLHGAVFQEKECLLSLLLGLQSGNSKKNNINTEKEFISLHYAIKNDMIDNFIFYELFLPDYPSLVRKMPAEQIKDIAEYVIRVRGELLKN